MTRDFSAPRRPPTSGATSHAEPERAQSYVRELDPSRDRVEEIPADLFGPDDGALTDSEWDASFLDDAPPPVAEVATAVRPVVSVVAAPAPRSTRADEMLALFDGGAITLDRAPTATPATKAAPVPTATKATPVPTATKATPMPAKATPVPVTSAVSAAPVERGEREPLAEFTCELVASMNRTTYYMPGHPAHIAVPVELFRSLASLLATQSQVGYLVLRDDPPVIYVDGLSGGRARLDETLGESAYAVFSPKFIEYMGRRDLVMMAFRQGLTFEEFDAFVSLVTRPAIGRERWAPLSDELLEARIAHVSVLATTDLDDIGADVPLLARVCVARLRRDLLSVPLRAGADPGSVERVAGQVFVDAMRPLTEVEHLKQVVLCAPLVERPLQSIPAVRHLRVAAHVVATLPGAAVVALTHALVASWIVAVRQRDASLTALRDAAIACAARLRTEDVAGADAALEALRQKGLLSYDDLPDWLQDEVNAEHLRAAVGRGERPAVASSTPRALRVLGKAAAMVLADHHPEHFAWLLRFLMGRRFGTDPTLADAAREALDGCATASALPELAAWLEGAQGDEASLVAALFGVMGEAGAAAVCRHIADVPTSVRAPGLVEALTRAGADAAGPLSDLLERADLPPATLRAVAALAARHPSPRTLAALSSLAGHAQPTLRMAALLSLRDAHGAAARPAFEAALRDPDGNVVLLAMTTLAARYEATAAVRAHALQCLRDAAPGTASALLLGAMKLLTDATGAERKTYVDALERLWKLHARETSIVRLGTGKGFDPDVIAAVREALARSDAPSGWQRLRGALR